jgi:hypothetical protein
MFKPISRVVLAALLVLAVSGPTVADARFNLNPEPPVSSQPQRNDQQPRTVPGRFAPEVDSQVAAPRVSVSATPHDGFRWSDAGIGAAGVLILVSGGIVASGAVRRRRSGGVAIG